MMKRLVHAFAAIFGVVVILAPSVEGAGMEYTTGSAGYHEYEKVRQVTNPAAPGAEVAFYQYTGGYLIMGTWWSAAYNTPMLPQQINTWKPVMYTEIPRYFKVRAEGTTNFSGDIAWD